MSIKQRQWLRFENKREISLISHTGPYDLKFNEPLTIKSIGRKEVAKGKKQAIGLFQTPRKIVQLASPHNFNSSIWIAPLRQRPSPRRPGRAKPGWLGWLCRPRQTCCIWRPTNLRNLCRKKYKSPANQKVFSSAASLTRFKMFEVKNPSKNI